MASTAQPDDRAPSETHSQYERLRLATDDRIVLMTLVSTGVGVLAGGYLGGQLSGRQYLAERAHRLPTTVSGWFFYQKWKNYRVLLGAMKGAVRYGGKVGGCVLAYSSIEATVDRLVGEAQVFSSVAAGLATAVGMSLIAGLPRSSARRARIVGLAVGAITGAAQDAARYRTTLQPPAYIIWARDRIKAAASPST
ncbi:hypothetical protein GGI15_001858 [Coemansia interrupta]|uniref:Uncharacterized protein n=1 Tax=Coemansia interrupta TaxID=1126814 RepID=A0A9W8LM48_9FUNG|nr:hypothetical protein GGI15_001858 [Coemansia interrupta]